MMSPEKRAQLISQYQRGPDEFEAALAEIPEESLDWKPGSEDWSVHEIVCHCADSETSGYTRIRTLIAEPNAYIVGYDQDRWATVFDYARVPIESALAVIRAVRAHTASLLDSLPEEAWSSVGRHSDAGAYTAEDWLRTYGVHLSDHADQIRRVHRKWLSQNKQTTSHTQ